MIVLLLPWQMDALHNDLSWSLARNTQFSFSAFLEIYLFWGMMAANWEAAKQRFIQGAERLIDDCDPLSELMGQACNKEFVVQMIEWYLKVQIPTDRVFNRLSMCYCRNKWSGVVFPKSPIFTDDPQVRTQIACWPFELHCEHDSQASLQSGGNAYKINVALFGRPENKVSLIFGDSTRLRAQFAEIDFSVGEIRRYLNTQLGQVREEAQYIPARGGRGDDEGGCTIEEVE